MTIPLRSLTTLVVFALSNTVLAQPYPVGATLPAASGRPIPRIVQQWADAWNQGDAPSMAALFASDGIYQDFAFQAKVTGQDGAASWVALTLKNIPDAHATLLDAFQIGDRAAVQWVFSGTPLGFGNLPVSAGGPGRKSFAVPVTSIFQLKNGKIAQVIDYYNRADLFHQAGLPSDNWVSPTP